MINQWLDTLIIDSQWSNVGTLALQWQPSIDISELGVPGLDTKYAGDTTSVVGLSISPLYTKVKNVTTKIII